MVCMHLPYLCICFIYLWLSRLAILYPFLSSSLSLSSVLHVCLCLPVCLHDLLLFSLSLSFLFLPYLSLNLCHLLSILSVWFSVPLFQSLSTSLLGASHLLADQPSPWISLFLSLSQGPCLLLLYLPVFLTLIHINFVSIYLFTISLLFISMYLNFFYTFHCIVASLSDSLPPHLSFNKPISLHVICQKRFVQCCVFL